MRRMLNWLKSWWGLGRVSRQLSAMDRRLDRLEKDRKRIEGKVENDWNLLQKWNDSISGGMVEMTELLAEKEALVKRYEEELEAARSKILTHEESITTLVAANATYKNLWDAVSAEQIRRRVAAAAPTQEGIE